MSLFPILALGGGAAYVATKGTPPHLQPEESLAEAIELKPELGNGAAPGATTTQLRNLGASFVAKRSLITAGAPTPPLMQESKTDLFGITQPTQYGEIDAALQEKLDIIKSYGQAAYDNLSDDAKKAGAKALSDELKLDPPLTGDEDWETIAKIAGGAAGVAAFGWLPGGAVWGPIVGTYLGVKIEDLISKDADEIKAWFSSKWSDIEGWVKGKAHDAYDAVSDFFGDIF